MQSSALSRRPTAVVFGILIRLFNSLTVIAFVLSGNLSFADRHNVSILDLPTYQSLHPNAACEAKLNQRLTKPFRRILGNGSDGQKMARAVAYLLKIKNPTQYELVVMWENFAKLIILRSKDQWNCTRFFGPDGEVGYVGAGGYAIYFSKSGRIYKGHVYENRFKVIDDENHWNGISDSIEPLN